MVSNPSAVLACLVCLVLALALPSPRLLRRVQHPGSGSGSGNAHSKRLPTTRLLWAVSTLGLVGMWALGASVILIALVMIAATLWRIASGIAVKRRSKQRKRYLSQVLGLVVGELRAGIPMDHALEHALEELSPVQARAAPIPQQLHATVRAMRLGAQGEKHLLAVAHEELVFMAQCWNVAARHGVALAPLIHQVQLRLDAELSHHSETNANLQGPQATAVLLSLLPLLGIGLGASMGANSVALFSTTAVGAVLLLVGTGLLCAGALWAHRILQGVAA
ncbi:type II secretion system F family protein [Corynebacterium kozikiae]|uniref:type II secretion system F family protein n=1 Tax=Corynebacterium kozikiae TaxID=2968469 RepID=UPI00211C7325|nr:type II secretion system F family protein [Corynebacterium sp. 76QC2CO]MCQ9342719.1 type II secretion system F family protein [Corynebacterium sp. 76QC2CO]